MNGFPSRETVERLRREYPEGTRVVLVKMDDPQAPPPGTKGTVRGVDDIGSVMVAWDNGSGLSAAYGEDIIRKLDTVKTVCYGKTDVWDSREEAMEFFLHGICETEGAERNRYVTVFTKLKAGMDVCSDDVDG